MKYLLLFTTSLILISCGNDPDTYLSVADTTVKKSRLNAIIEATLASKVSYTKEDSLKLAELIIDELITNAVLVKAAKEAGIEADTAFLNRQKQMTRAAFRNDSLFTLELNKMALTEEQWMEDIRNASRVNSYLKAEITDKIASPDVRIADSLKAALVEPEVKISQIMIKLPADASKELLTAAYKKLELIRNLARKGTDKDFNRLAKQYSQDGSARFGGDIGFIRKGSLISQIEDMAFATPIGEVSDVFRSPIGLHIIRVTDKRDVKPDENTISDFALAKTREQAYLRLRDSLKTVYPVSYAD